LDTLEQVRTQDPVRPTRLQSKTPGDLETAAADDIRLSRSEQGRG
jgi:hypothetical protein